VRFGWEQAIRPGFDGAEWEDVEEVLQERWEQSDPHADYEDWRSVVEGYGSASSAPRRRCRRPNSPVGVEASA
jgi:hypothetical protein